MKIRDIIVESIRDPEFKSWFGKSKVVDFKGKPLIVYHGGSYPSAGREFKGDTWFTIHVRDAYQYAKRDGSNVTSAYLSVQNPYVLQDGEDIYSVLGRVRGGSEYDGVYDPEVGDWVVWTSHQIRPIKTRNIGESVAENSNNTTTLNQLYNGNYPGRDEQLWNWVGLVDLDKPLNINRMSAQMLRSMLETQYHVDSYDDLVERLDADRRKLLKRYMNDQQLSNSIIVLCNDRVIDGNHRALAAALRGSTIRYVDVADLDNQQLDESSESNDAAFIGYLSPDGKFECYSQSEAARVDYHHSMIVQDLDAYNAEGGLTFVRYDAEPLITIKGTPAIDPYDRRSAPMISKLARKIIQCGADPDLPIGIDNMGFKRTEAPYQGKQIGSLRSWAQRNVGIDEAVLDPRGAGSTPYGVDIDYFGLRVQMRPSTFLKLALPLTPATTSKTLGPYMKQGGAIAHPMLDFEMPDGWFSDDYSEPARIVDHEGRNRMKHWMRLHGDDPIQINMRPHGGLRRRDITSEMIQQLSAGMIGQRGDYIDGPLFEPSTALEERNILSEIQYSNSIADSSRIIAALKPANSIKLGVVDNRTVYKLDASDCYVYYLYDIEHDRPLAYIITEKFKIEGYYPFRQAEKLVDTSGVAMALLQFLRHYGIKLVVRSDEPMTLKGIMWLTKIIQNPRGLKIHDGSGKSVNLQELWNEWYASHEDYENTGAISIFIESKNDRSKSNYCFEDQTNYSGLMRNPLRYIGDKELY